MGLKHVSVDRQVLAAVIKAGASREHEMLAEIQGAVFSFIRKMENRAAMDTMLVSRVRILYIRSLLSRAPELQSLKVTEKGLHITTALAGLWQDLVACSIIIFPISKWLSIV